MYEHLTSAQHEKTRPLERVLRDVQREVGGLEENKKVIHDSLGKLIYRYSDTRDPDEPYDKTDPAGLTKVNEQNTIAAIELKKNSNKVIIIMIILFFIGYVR